MSPYPSLTQDLLRRALAGEPRAARLVVDELTPVIKKRVSRALSQRRSASRGRDLQQEVMDLTQQVFEILFADRGRVLASWQPEKGLSLLNFVGLVAERETASILRSGRRSPWTDDPTLVDDFASNPALEVPPDDRVVSQDLLEQILDALRMRLSPLGLYLFTLIFVEERSVDEVCAELQMTNEKVYVWRCRLRKLVRQLADELSAELAPSQLPGTSRQVR